MSAQENLFQEVVIGDHSWNPPNYSYELQTFYETPDPILSQNNQLSDIPERQESFTLPSTKVINTLPLSLPASKLVCQRYTVLMKAVQVQSSGNIPVSST